MTGAPRLAVSIAADHPAPVRAALAAAASGADAITLVLGGRQPDAADLAALRARLAVPLGLEIDAGGDMLETALRHRPDAVRLAPADAAGDAERLRPAVARLAAAGIRAALLIRPEARQVDAAIRCGVPVVTLDAGGYAAVDGEARAAELRRIADAAALAVKNGIEPHAGRGLDAETVVPVAAIPQLRMLDIDLPDDEEGIGRMRALIAEARG